MSQVQTIHAKLLKIVDAIQNAETKQKVTAMIEDPRLMNLLMSCPASIQESTGGAYVGGLLDYAILTTSYLKKMASPIRNYFHRKYRHCWRICWRNAARTNCWPLRKCSVRKSCWPCACTSAFPTPPTRSAPSTPSYSTPAAWCRRR